MSEPRAAIEQADVVIAGGGLAGLTLALQLRRRFPAIDVLVLERQRHPVPEATHKVGESSVEIGGHYFDAVLGLREHLDAHQLRKFGFRFFFNDGRERIDDCLELGASRYLTTPSWQLDRGVFENFLARHAAAQGVRFVDGAVVRGITLGEGDAPHVVAYERDGERRAAQARWLVDASGRAGLLKRQLGLARDNAHDANAVWFRIGARIDVDEWSADPDWHARCEVPLRWLSTNHLCGDGYWAWLIPLSSGSHSVGIVCDAKTHPLETMNSFERAMAWFAVHQPRLHRELEDKRHLLQDFRFLRNFSYGCSQVFSGRRWALTGEAGVFLDPFYSPGSDFIAIANTYVCELVAKDRAGEPVDPYARFYEQIYFSFYESTLTLYTGQYGLFGDPEVMPVKVLWDYTYYWGVLCQLFFQDRLTDLVTLGRLRPRLQASIALNAAMQEFLRAWSARSARRNPAIMLDQAKLGWFAELNRGLRDTLDDAQFRERMHATTTQLAALAAEIVQRACAEYPGLDASAVHALLGDSPRADESLLFADAA
jgi:flavin-dependent dehydrogenase